MKGEKKCLVEVKMENTDDGTCRVFSFRTGESHFCRDGRPRLYLLEKVAEERAKARNISGKILPSTLRVVQDPKPRRKK